MEPPESSARLSTALAGRYRIERELGQGGMAVVYLAHDVRHDRQVALKVLRPDLAAVIGAGRFLHEIKTTAHLQHPHILPLHDSGEVNGTAFYVMPFVEGESLRARLVRERQLPVDEAVRIAIEVASALDYAHRHGVIHRDIKPENILLHDGRALVADFGIALAAARTGQDRLTETGLSLGTPGYMSPEQAMGERVLDGRTDLYALGCVLYEMLTGEVPFTGPTAQAIIARVATERPRPLILQRHTIPVGVEAAVMTALEKLPADRFATAQDFVAALKNPSHAGLATSSATALPFPTRWSRWALAGWGVAAGAVLFAFWMGNRGRPPNPVTRVGLSFPASQIPSSWGFAFTPDGTHLLYPGPGEQGSQIWVKRRDRYEATPLAGTSGIEGDVTVSPDGEWLAFVQGQQLKKMPLTGGDAMALDSAFIGGIAWLDDGSLIYRLHRGELRRVSAQGGPPTTVWGRDSLWMRVFLTPLPGARGVLFTKCSAPGCNPVHELWVLDLRSGQERRLLSGTLKGWYLPTGHLAFVREDGRMYAVPFDLGGLELRGTPVPVLEGISLALGIAPQVAISSSGDLVMQTSGGAGLELEVFQMLELDRSGRASPMDTSWRFHLGVFDAGGEARGWGLAPDGGSLAIGLYTAAGNDIWIRQLPHGPLSRLTSDETSSEFSPRWTPDGRSVTYVRNQGGDAEVWQRRADGTGAAVRSLNWVGNPRDIAWTRDGRWLILCTGWAGGRLDLLVFQPGVDSIPRPLLADPRFDEAAPALSPDGHWLAYMSAETGRSEVYLRPFPNIDAEKWQVSNGGGTAPLWAHSGRELFYVDGARNMVVTPVITGSAAVRLGGRQVLFRLEDSLFLSDYRTPFDITPDDRRFLMARQVNPGTSGAATFILVENWFEELKQKLREGRRD